MVNIATLAREVNTDLYGIDPKTEVFIRVSVSDDGDAACVDRLYDMLESDIKLRKYYSDVSDLPAAVLSLLHTVRLVDVGVVIKGVGWRPAENTYWLVVKREDVT